jgi:hypothetical protein
MIVPFHFTRIENDNITDRLFIRFVTIAMKQANARFSRSSVPPSETGLIWSIVKGINYHRSFVWQYSQRYLAR